jgi:hypothetical protein
MSDFFVGQQMLLDVSGAGKARELTVYHFAVLHELRVSVKQISWKKAISQKGAKDRKNSEYLVVALFQFLSAFSAWPSVISLCGFTPDVRNNRRGRGGFRRAPQRKSKFGHYRRLMN